MSGSEATGTIGSVKVVTHGRTEEVAQAIAGLKKAAAKAGVEVSFEDENGVEPGDADLTIVLGGDGATLRALRANAGTDTPVFAINFGRIGFLATADREELDEAIERALSGRFEAVPMPAMVLDDGAPDHFAINEISFQRRSHLNLANISYSIAGEPIGDHVPCDGLIAATPAGSTGYNLSVGGPILAWGIRGYTVSLIAPHALNVRALVAAPEDALHVTNEMDEPVDIVVDGMRTGELVEGKEVEIVFRPDVVGLAQLPGSSFYRRFREKLLMLTS